MLGTVRRRRKKECSWASGGDACPSRVLAPSRVLVQDASGDHWCAFHKPSEWSSDTGLGEAQLLELLRELIDVQAKKFKAINLPDFVLPASFELSSASLLGLEMRVGWADGITAIHLRGVRCPGDVLISVDWPTGPASHVPLEISLSDASIGGVIRIDASHGAEFRDLEFEGASADGIALTGPPAGAHIRKIGLRHAKVAGSVQITDVRVSEAVLADAMTVGGTFALTNCEIRTPPEGPNYDFVDPIDRVFERALSFGRSTEGSNPSAPRLKVDHCEIHGAVLLSTSAITEFLQMTRTRVDGIVETDQAAYPAGSVIFEFEQALGLIGAKRVNVASHQTARPFEHAKLRRSFAGLRAATTDPDQRAALLRLERAAMQKIHRVKPAKRLVWIIHEFLTDAGPNWAFPVVLLLASGIFFWMVFAVSVPENTLAHAAAVSVANSFTPFLSLESMVSEHSLLEVLLSFFQSALSAGLISSAVVAIRSDVEH